MRFVCDVMLGRLAKYLRILGFDAEYVRNDAAPERYGLDADDRIFLTRRTKATGYPGVILIRSEKTREQIKEIKGLIQPDIRPERMFNRCIECNVELIEVNKVEIESLVAEFVYHRYARFKQCPSCKRVYWEGTHTEGMDRLLKEILS
jgi:uncharacterized protein with PIN domain